MGWASKHIERLKAGETVSFHANGKSMLGRIDPGQQVTVEPIVDNNTINIDDIVLCLIHGRQFLHLVKNKRNGQFQIGNNHGYTNGWTPHIFGRVIKIE